MMVNPNRLPNLRIIIPDVDIYVMNRLSSAYNGTVPTGHAGKIADVGDFEGLSHLAVQLPDITDVRKRSQCHDLI
jgi:hypothetical protein